MITNGQEVSNRSRAAILPYPGDPFLLQFWLKNFYTHWADEIDKLYIICNTPVEKEVADYIEKLCQNPKIDYTYIDHHIQHGDAIRIGLEKATEEYVMLVEDDAYILRSGVVDECFARIESGQFDIVGSKRGSCDEEISKEAQRVYDISYEGEGDQGCNFWPNFFFMKRELLLSTDRDFNSRAWVQGEIIPPLQHYVVAAPVISSDTFVWASLQLRAMIPEQRIFYVNQYHAHPSDAEHYQRQNHIFDGKCPWIHIGSLSSGPSGAIMDDQGRSISKRTREAPKGKTVLPAAWCDVSSDFAKMEWERRVQWWLMFWELRDPEAIPEYAALYKAGIDRIIEQFELNVKRIRSRQQMYRTIGIDVERYDGTAKIYLS